MSAGVAVVALTARTGEPMDSDLVGLWTNSVIERIDVGPLNRSDHRTLLETRLGLVSDDLESELWRLAEGNPLILHELIEGAIGISIEKGGDDVWALTGQLVESPRLFDLVTSRLRSLADDLRPAMDIVAVGAPLPWHLAEEAMGADLAALEDRGLIASSGTDLDRKLVAAHPLYGEILKAHIGETRTQMAQRHLVDAATRVDALPDPLQVALWQRDCGVVVSEELALAGAQAALVRHEPGLTEEILRPLGAEDDGVALLLGRALSYRQQYDEAEALLAGREPSDEALLGEITSIRAQNMGFGLGRVFEARNLLHDAAERIENPDLRARLINERAMVSAIHGDFVDSTESSDQVLSDPDTSVVSRAAAYVTLTVALAMTGDCDRMDEVIDDALVVSAEAKKVLPFARDQVGVMQVSSALHAGRIPEAIRFCSRALNKRDGGNAMRTTWLSSSVMGLDLAGRLLDAKAAAQEALEIYAEADPFGLEAITRGAIGLTAGQMGESVPEASFGLSHPQSGPRLAVWLLRGQAWSAAARGDLESAVQTALQGGREGMEGEHFAWAALCFSDVARFGGASRVLGEMRQIDTSKGAHLIDALRQHAEAAAIEDPETLNGVAKRFASFGGWLLAAEAYAQAAALHDSRDDAARAARNAALSMTAEGHCQEPKTPALAARPALVTPRELEVALDAADGMTSPQISDKRYISVRTVDNHLSSVYRKLDLSGRDELATLFPIQSSPAAPGAEN